MTRVTLKSIKRTLISFLSIQIHFRMNDIFFHFPWIRKYLDIIEAFDRRDETRPQLMQVHVCSSYETGIP